MNDIHRDSHVPSFGTSPRIKQDASVGLVRAKSRLVTRDNLRSDPVDYAELYAPAACIELASIVLFVATTKD